MYGDTILYLTSVPQNVAISWHQYTVQEISTTASQATGAFVVNLKPKLIGSAENDCQKFL